MQITIKFWKKIYLFPIDIFQLLSIEWDFMFLLAPDHASLQPIIIWHPPVTNWLLIIAAGSIALSSGSFSLR